MLFNTLYYAIFLPVVFCLYWFLWKGRQPVQNVILLIASYFFYGCWDYRFLFLLIFSTTLDYYTGIKIQDSQKKSSGKIWFLTSVLVNLGFLGVFKYYNFFAESFQYGLMKLGMKADLPTLKVILPVGISFYTFHGLSYVIDIYKRRISAERNFIDYSVFVCFFPLLVAGPIERATHLLPQLKRERTFEYDKAIDGLRQILWGLFKKVVIADNCAQYVNTIFAHSDSYHGSTLVVGAILFSFQIYCDFSGYSDVAIGTARLFGISLLRNFAFPYFSRDIAEFWRRWHISLSSWFRDYLYIPLGGSKGSRLKVVRNIFIIFLVSGFWHGANWTFIIWGGLNAAYFLPLLLLNRNRDHLEMVASGRFFPGLKELSQILITFGLTTFAWIFFRAESVTSAFHYIRSIFNASLFSIPEIRPMYLGLILSVFILVEWIGREQQYAIQAFLLKTFRPVRIATYLLIALLVLLNQSHQQPFIYFQF